MKLASSKTQRIEISFGRDFIVYVVDDTPTSIAEAYASLDADDWKEVVHNETDLILSNGMWDNHLADFGRAHMLVIT